LFPKANKGYKLIDNIFFQIDKPDFMKCFGEVDKKGLFINNS